MKKLIPPIVIDESILIELSQNEALHKTSYPHLREQLNTINTAYSDYCNHSGNPWNIVVPQLTEELQSALIKHYTSPPNALDFLDDLRNSSPDVCPMCGGFHPTTLDHLLPKEDYPVWAIFSKNLVPACDCNMKRGAILKGSSSTQARILHPYFDNCLSERQLTAKISHSADFELLEASIDYVNPTHYDIESIKFHTKNITIKIGIEKWFQGQLNKLKEFPANIIKSLPRKRVIDREQLLEAFEYTLDGYDVQCGTPNNWNSILIHGLSNTFEIHEWIVETHNEILNQLDTNLT